MAQNWNRWCQQLGLVSALVIAGAFMELPLGITASLGNYASAQIRPDRTLGNERSSVTRNVLIKGLSSDQIEGGAKRGANLFHSFQEFNVGDGQRVYFANPTGIENILSRVTGSSFSKIQGTLGVLGKANLFLINPNGILFGPNASLDVNGSFVATTADAIQFDDQGFFSASAPDAPPVLTVNPSAFFFNRVAAQPILNQSESGLQVPDDRSLLLVGGDVSLDGGILLAPGGQVELGGVAGGRTVGLDVDGNILDLSFPSEVEQLADVSITNEAYINTVAQDDPGSIAVNARDLYISINSLILKTTQNLPKTTRNYVIFTSSITTNTAQAEVIKSITDTVFVAGDIEIIAESIIVNDEALTVRAEVILPEQEVVDVSGLVSQNCSAGGGAAGRGASKLVVTGRGGLPTTPYEPLDSHDILADVQLPTQWRSNPVGAASTSISPKTAPDEIVEAQGWVRGPSGEMVLTAQAQTVTPHSPGLASASCRGS